MRGKQRAGAVFCWCTFLSRAGHAIAYNGIAGSICFVDHPNIAEAFFRLHDALACGAPMCKQQWGYGPIKDFKFWSHNFCDDSPCLSQHCLPLSHGNAEMCACLGSSEPLPSSHRNGRRGHCRFTSSHTLGMHRGMPVIPFFAIGSMPALAFG